MKCFIFTGAAVLFLTCPFVRADVHPNSLFTDNMVLQQGIPVTVWGTANPKEAISVKFADQSVAAQADADGNWSAKLQPLKAGGPFTLTMAGTNSVTVNNVLVGEVWICSGQSNMERQLGLRPPQQPIDNWEQEAASAHFPEIREFFVPEKGEKAPQKDANGKWVVCSPQTAATFSAVSFFFSRSLYQKIHTPIGLIFSSVGGTKAELWTSYDALMANPETSIVQAAFEKSIKDYQVKLAEYQKSLPKLTQKYQEDLAAAQKEGRPAPRPPAPPRDPSKRPPGSLYNAMIAPLIPYAIKGVIWYQGESNGGAGKQYQTLFPLLISDWRQRWAQGDFPFLFVQIAPFHGADPKIREAQMMTFKSVPNTAMAVTTDIGDINDIHPPHKAPVGERLALAARALAYGEKIEYSGPLFDSAKITGNQVVVSFTHLGSGLVAKDGPLQGFELSGTDKKFFPAKAEIQGDTIVVTSDQVPNPVYVRYGWANSPVVNLFNKEQLPASPFRTDTD